MSLAKLCIIGNVCSGVGTEIRSLFRAIYVFLNGILWIVATSGETQGQASHCYI